MKYLVLLRGINVGGKNKLSMPRLKTFLEELNFNHVETYIQSGNVLLESSLSAGSTAKRIEDTLTKKFTLDSALIRILVLPLDKLKEVVDKAPKGFGTQTDTYKYDVVFLIGISEKEALPHFDLHPEVDTVWARNGVVYYRRLVARITSSRISKIVGKPIYQSMTIRTWNTVIKLLGLSTRHIG